MLWSVKLTDKNVSTLVTAKTRGAAAKKAFKKWIKEEVIKNQPLSREGWFKNVECEPIRVLP